MMPVSGMLVLRNLVLGSCFKLSLEVGNSNLIFKENVNIARHYAWQCSAILQGLE